MRYSRVHLESLGYELAPVVVDSRELEDRLAPVYDKLHLPPGQLEVLTGIEERRYWEPGFRLSDGAIAAGRHALEQSPVTAEHLEVLIYAGVCREQFEPATACRVAAELGVSRSAAIYDVSNACLGVLNGILDVANRIELGQIRAGIIVSCESAREINDIMIQRMLARPEMRFVQLTLATLTGGSGAAAVILSDGSFGDWRARFLAGVHENAPEHHELCQWGYETTDAARGIHEEYMRTDSVAVLEHGVELGLRTWRSLTSELDCDASNIDKTICHQVGSAHRATILDKIEIAPQRDFITYPFLGNIGTVSLPMTAAIAAERGFIERGDLVAFLGIGSGLNCLMQGWQW